MWSWFLKWLYPPGYCFSNNFFLNVRKWTLGTAGLPFGEFPLKISQNLEPFFFKCEEVNIRHSRSQAGSFCKKRWGSEKWSWGHEKSEKIGCVSEICWRWLVASTWVSTPGLKSSLTSEWREPGGNIFPKFGNFFFKCEEVNIRHSRTPFRNWIFFACSWPPKTHLFWFDAMRRTKKNARFSE